MIFKIINHTFIGDTLIYIHNLNVFHIISISEVYVTEKHDKSEIFFEIITTNSNLNIRIWCPLKYYVGKTIMPGIIDYDKTKSEFIMRYKNLFYNWKEYHNDTNSTSSNRLNEYTFKPEKVTYTAKDLEEGLDTPEEIKATINLIKDKQNGIQNNN